MSTRSGIRMSADERRDAVVAAAIIEFAQGGLDGTSTEAIAARAGISQPYLFRLFPTKQSLFLATVERTFDRIVATFDAVSRGLEGQAALDEMGESYFELLADHDLLLVQLHAYAASARPEIQEVVRARFAGLLEFVVDRTGLGPDVLQPFFAMGMLCNVVAALRLDAIGDLWQEMSRKAKLARPIFPAASS